MNIKKTEKLLLFVRMNLFLYITSYILLHIQYVNNIFIFLNNSVLIIYV